MTTSLSLPKPAGANFKVSKTPENPSLKVLVAQAMAEAWN